MATTTNILALETGLTDSDSCSDDDEKNIFSPETSIKEFKNKLVKKVNETFASLYLNKKGRQELEQHLKAYIDGIITKATNASKTCGSSRHEVFSTIETDNFSLKYQPFCWHVDFDKTTNQKLFYTLPVRLNSFLYKGFLGSFRSVGDCNEEELKKRRRKDLIIICSPFAAALTIFAGYKTYQWWKNRKARQTKKA
jgi:hypothetical protein